MLLKDFGGRTQDRDAQIAVVVRDLCGLSASRCWHRQLVSTR